MVKVLYHYTCKLHLPKILETPYVGEDKKNKKPPYKFEIEMIRDGKFITDLKEQIVNQ